MNGGPLGITRSLAAANPVLLPKPEPRTMREQVVVPAIRRRNVAGVQRPGIRDRVHALQPLDFGNGPLGVHPSQYGPESQEGQSVAVCRKMLAEGLAGFAVSPRQRVADLICDDTPIEAARWLPLLDPLKSLPPGSDCFRSLTRRPV